MSAPIITVFPKADQVIIKEEQKLPNGDKVILQTYKFRKQTVYTIRIWISLSDTGYDIMNKIEYQNYTD